MRFSTATCLALTFAAGMAHAKSIDPPSLARYDASYGRCEARFAEMRGHRDDAYLDLWHLRHDDKSTARLAQMRSSAAYRAETQRLAKAAAARATAAASSALERECQGLWGEHQRVGTAGKK